MPFAQGFPTTRPQTLAFHLFLLLRPICPFFAPVALAFCTAEQQALADFEKLLEIVEHEFVVDCSSRKVCSGVVVVALPIQVDYNVSLVIFIQLTLRFAKQQLDFTRGFVQNVVPFCVVEGFGRGIDFHVVQAVECAGKMLEVFVETAQSLQKTKMLEIVQNVGRNLKS